MANEFLGTGWKLPLAVDQNGQLELVSQEESVHQSIWTILSTAAGERVMLPDFGCGIHDLVFSVNSPGTAGRVASQVRDALLRWEHRIDVLNVAANPDTIEPNLLLIEIDYRIRTTNSLFNVVYPFYLE